MSIVEWLRFVIRLMKQNASIQCDPYTNGEKGPAIYSHRQQASGISRAMVVNGCGSRSVRNKGVLVYLSDLHHKGHYGGKPFKTINRCIMIPKQRLVLIMQTFPHQREKGHASPILGPFHSGGGRGGSARGQINTLITLYLLFDVTSRPSLFSNNSTIALLHCHFPFLGPSLLLSSPKYS